LAAQFDAFAAKLNVARLATSWLIGSCKRTSL